MVYSTAIPTPYMHLLPLRRRSYYGGEGTPPGEGGAGLSLHLNDLNALTPLHINAFETITCMLIRTVDTRIKIKY